MKARLRADISFLICLNFVKSQIPYFWIVNNKDIFTADT